MRFGSASSLVVGRSGRAPEGATTAARHFDGTQILVPLLTRDVAVVTDQIRVAASLARTTDASLHVVNPVTDSEQPLGAHRHDPTADDEEVLLDWALGEGAAPDGAAGGLSTRTLVRRLVDTIAANDVETLVVPSAAAAGVVRRGIAGRLALQADCDVVTVNGRHGYEGTPSILLAVAGGPHSRLAADVAGRIAADCDAWIDVLHAVESPPPSGRRERGEALVEEVARRIDRPETTTTRVVETDDAADAIVEQSAYYELSVIGAPTKGRLRRFVFGSTNRTIRDNARSVVLSTRANR